MWWVDAGRRRDEGVRVGVLGRMSGAEATRKSQGVSGVRRSGRTVADALCRSRADAGGRRWTSRADAGRIRREHTGASWSQSAPATTNLPAGQGQATTPSNEPTNSAVPQETPQDQVIKGKAIQELTVGQKGSLWNYKGRTVVKIVFSGVVFSSDRDAAE